MKSVGITFDKTIVAECDQTLDGGSTMYGEPPEFAQRTLQPARQ
jgi:hypothetical protein